MFHQQGHRWGSQLWTATPTSTPPTPSRHSTGHLTTCPSGHDQCPAARDDVCVDVVVCFVATESMSASQEAGPPAWGSPEAAATFQSAAPLGAPRTQKPWGRGPGACQEQASEKAWPLPSWPSEPLSQGRMVAPRLEALVSPRAGAARPQQPAADCLPGAEPVK